jgi:XTP/dITP diphosphohydrolase
MSSTPAMSGSPTATMMWKINTSNAGKLKEFGRIFSGHGISLLSTAIDLREPEADPTTVIVVKASQVGQRTLVEDTALDVEGADVGINVRWLLDNLSNCIGRKAVWRVRLAYREGNEVHIYKGEVRGTIVVSRGKEGFGFDPVFLPQDSDQTLAENKPDTVNARSLAIDALIHKKNLETKKVIDNWSGPWQQH